MSQLNWKWEDESHFRAVADKEGTGPGVLHLVIGKDPSMSVVVTAKLVDRLSHLPPPILLTSQAIQLAALKTAENLISEFRGVNLDTTILVWRCQMTVGSEHGCSFQFPVVAIWDYGKTTLVHESAITLPESYFVEMQLLRTELFHRYGGVDD